MTPQCCPRIGLTTTFLQQILYNAVQQVASKFTGAAKQKYTEAASTFRLPYWDWAITPPDASFPSSISSSDSVTVIAPSTDGSPVQMNIPNPLYSYTFDVKFVDNGGWFDSPVSTSSTFVSKAMYSQ
jgi:hypothetical protein